MRSGVKIRVMGVRIPPVVPAETGVAGIHRLCRTVELDGFCKIGIIYRTSGRVDKCSWL